MNTGTPAEWDDVDLDSELIKRIQEKLFDTPEDVTGIYNIETQEAVEEFQSQHSLRVDGLPGPITLGEMGINTGFIGEQDYRGAVTEDDQTGCDMSAPDLPGDTTTDPR